MPGQDRGQVDVGDAAGPPRRGQELGGLAGPRSASCDHVLGDAAEGQARHGRPDHPAGSAPRCSRQARASGLRSQGGASAGPSRVGSTPAPRSRRTEQGRGRRQQDAEQRPPAGAGPTSARRRTAGPARPSRWATATTASDSSVEVSPMARSRKARPSAAKAMPLAGRAYSVSWAVTAATPAKTRPLQAAADGQGDRPRRREAHGDVPGRGDRGQHDVDRQHEQQAGGQPGVPADHAGARPARPGPSPPPAGVPGHQRAGSSGAMRKTQG